jgi:hypothetical protein
MLLSQDLRGLLPAYVPGKPIEEIEQVLAIHAKLASND